MIVAPFIHYILVISRSLFFAIWIGFLLFHVAVLSPLIAGMEGEARVVFNSGLYKKETAAFRISGIVSIVSGILAAMYPELNFTNFVSIFGINSISISTLIALASLLGAGEAALIATMRKYRNIARRVVNEPLGYVPAHMLVLEKKVWALSIVGALATIASLSVILVW